MIHDIVFLTEIKKQVDALDCWNCRRKLSFKSMEYNENFNHYEEETLTIEAHCKFCKINATVLMKIEV